VTSGSHSLKLHDNRKFRREGRRGCQRMIGAGRGGRVSRREEKILEWSRKGTAADFYHVQGVNRGELKEVPKWAC